LNAGTNTGRLRRKQQLFATLEQQGVAMGFKPSAFDNFKALLNKHFDVANRQNMAELRKSFLDDFINENTRPCNRSYASANHAEE
jgi:hypothetical protein